MCVLLVGLSVTERLSGTVSSPAVNCAVYRLLAAESRRRGTSAVSQPLWPSDDCGAGRKLVAGCRKRVAMEEISIMRRTGVVSGRRIGTGERETRRRERSGALCRQLGRRERSRLDGVSSAGTAARWAVGPGTRHICAAGSADRMWPHHSVSSFLFKICIRVYAERFVRVSTTRFRGGFSNFKYHWLSCDSECPLN